jgi:hypothetical protein
MFRESFSTKFFGRDLGWLLLTGGYCSEVVVSTGLTVVEVNLSLWIKTNKDALYVSPH